MNFKNKFMDRMFKEVENVVIDMTTNSIGIKRDGSVYTICKDEEGEYGLSENILEEMSANIPAFAQSTPLDKVKEKDLILNASGDVVGWVIKKMPKSLKVLKTTGHVTNIVPAKANLFGQGQNVMVVSSMMGDNLQGSLPMLMAMSDDESSMKEMIPFLMMSNSGQAMDPMMMAMMMSKGSGDNDMMKTMMMMQMMQGQQGQEGSAPAMNPMMMAMMMAK